MKARVNDLFVFDFDSNDFDWSCIKLNCGQYHIIFKEQSFVANVVEVNTAKKNLLIRINNNNYNVQLKDQHDELLQSLGMDVLNNQNESEIKAPMPGRVLDIMLNAGDAVAKGDGVLVLEAMKMENVIKSPTDGIIKLISIEKGLAVEKGQVLVEFE